MSTEYTYIIYSQHTTSPITPSSTGSIKGFSNNEDDARKIAKQIIETEYKFDDTPIHSAIIRYKNGPLTHAIWSLDCFGYDTDNKLVTSFEINNGIITEKKVKIDDLNSRVVENKSLVGTIKNLINI